MSNLNHFILQFVNSKDIREYLRTIDYQFNALEAAWLIWQSCNTTVDERHQAWKKVILESPDCPIEERMNTRQQPSLHGFLREYMEMENKFLAQFRNADGAVYHIEYHFDTWSRGEKRVYSRFVPEKMSCMIEDDDDLKHIKCTRTPVDNLDGNTLSVSSHVILDRNMRIMSINPDSYVDEHEDEIMMEVFQGLWFDFPTPFHKGDILWDPKSSSDFTGGPFVCTGINHHQFNNEKGMIWLQRDGDNSDMNAHGLFVSNEYGVYAEVMSNYMDCEFFTGELTGCRRFLIPFRAYEKGEADAELLVHALHYMRAETEKEKCGLVFYTAEVLKKMGIE